MDLPICPHCGQSVLDDDVDECPFCGESMSAKPSGKKPAQAKPSPAPLATKPAPSEAKPSATRPAKPKPKSSEAVASADQPFAVDHAALTNAVPLRSSASPGRTYKVVCPMCETAGYTSPKAAGREVKCANPKCLVPIFTCPEPPPAPVEDAPPEPSSMSTTQLGILSVVALAAIGWGIWFFVLKNDNPTPIPQDPPAGLAVKTENGQVKSSPDSATEQPKQVTPQVTAGSDLAKLRPEAVEKMVEFAKVRMARGDSRPIPLRFQWIALSYAELGDLTNAQTQLDRLAGLSDDEPHYRVLPWVEIGWKLREREESAKEAADKALEFAKNEPASLHDSWREAVSLAALLAALGRSEEALPLMERKLGLPLEQEFRADMMAVTLDRTFNLEALERTRPLVTPTNPTWSAVVWQLVFHDASKEALDWANRAQVLGTRAESLIAWADAVATKSLAEKSPADLAPLDAAIASLPDHWPAVVTARAYARMGQRHVIAGDEAQAKTLLQKAESALASFPKSEPLPVPDLEGIYRAKFSQMNKSHEIAVAAFEVARLDASLKQTEPAWNSIEQGLSALRSESLPLPVVKRMLAEIKSNGALLQTELRTALALNSDDETRQAYLTYQKNVNELERRASSRLQLQAELLGHVARWNLAEQVAAEILKVSDEEGGDAYFETDLPWLVLSALAGKAPEQATAIDAKLKAKRQTKPKRLALLDDSAKAMNDLDIPKVIALLGRGTPALPDSQRRRWLLRLSTQQVLNGQAEPMLSFLLGLFNVDPFLGEDAAELIVALATRQGQGKLVWTEMEQRSWATTQRLAGYRGFIAAVDPAEEEAKN